jgi:hypothetical protein
MQQNSSTQTLNQASLALNQESVHSDIGKNLAHCLFSWSPVPKNDPYIF